MIYPPSNFLRRSIALLMVSVFVITNPGVIYAAEHAAEVVPAVENKVSDQSGITPAPATEEMAEAPVADKATEDAGVVSGSIEQQASTLTTEPTYEGEKRQLGEKAPYSYDAVNGSLVFNFPIKTPPGRNGIEPDLQLSYDSSAAANDSPFGAGWSLNIPYIERINRHGANRMYNEDLFYSSLDGELATTSAGVEDDQMDMMSGQDDSSLLNSAAIVSGDQADYKMSLFIDADLAIEKQDGSAEMREPIESKARQAVNSKSYLIGFDHKGQAIYQGKFYPAPIHYRDQQTGQWKDINTTLQDGLDAYTMDKAPYHARLKTSIKENNPITFKNNTQELYFSLSPFSKGGVEGDLSAPEAEIQNATPNPLLTKEGWPEAGLPAEASAQEGEVATPSLSPVIPAEAGIQEEAEGTGIAQKDIYNAEWSNKRVFYKNALAPDIDLSISLNDNELIKEAVIKNVNALANLPLRRSAAPPLIKGRIENNPLLTKEGWPEAGEVAAQTYDLSFTLSANQKIDLIAEGQKLSQAKTITTDQMVQIVSNDGTTSYIYPPYAQDSSSITNPNHRINISITYTRNDDGTITLTKHLPEGWAKQAQYPIRTDATISVYAGSGDGWVARGYLGTPGESWTTLRNASTGNFANYTGEYTQLRCMNDGAYDTRTFIGRGYFPFDTSALDDYVTVTAARLYLNPYYVDASGHEFTLVQGSQTDPASLAYADYDNIGSAEGADRVSSWTANSYSYFDLNAAGTAWISKTGWTKLSIRERHDIDNIEPGLYTYYGIFPWTSEKAGTEYDPYLIVTYSELQNESPTAPTSLQTENQTNPIGISTSTPRFSAVFNDSDAGAYARYAQIQISNTTDNWSNLIWDSGMRTLTASTTSGNRSEQITYNGTPFMNDGIKYYWRMKFWDQYGYEGSWSAGSDRFTMLSSTTQTYGAKVENGSFNKYEYMVGDYWRVTDKKGTVYKFGTTAASRQDYATTTTKNLRWQLEEVRDRNDNFIKYEYYKDAGQIYPDKITYTGHGEDSGIFEVEFLRENRNDHFPAYKNGFSAAYNYRINSIRTRINDGLSRQYNISYTAGNNGSRSLINTIQETGYDESGASTALPAYDFDYQGKSISFINGSSGTNSTDSRLTSGDFNGDGLADMVALHNGDPAIFLNNGNGGGWSYATTSPIFTNDHIVDLNGDGYADFLRMIYIGSDSYYLRGYINNKDLTWSAGGGLGVRRDYASFPIGDFNGDGLADIIMYNSDETRLVIYLNTGGGWTDAGTFPSALGLTSFAADVNGDGLDDFIQKQGYNIVVYINNGDLTWIQPYGFYLQTGDNNPMGPIGDFNGDGLPDLVHYNSSHTAIAIYLNRGNGTGWDEATNTPSNIGYNCLVLDVNGDGLSDFAYKDGYSIVNYANQSLKADLLNKIKFSSGGELKATYKHTAEYYAGGLLNKLMPYSLPTVHYLASNDGFNHYATTTYEYDGGVQYYNNPYDRKFAGFATTTIIDARGNVTKNFYHQGNTTASTTGEYDDHYSKIGRIYRTESYDNAGHLYNQNISYWDRYDLGNDRNFVKLIRSLDMSYDGNSSHRDRAEEYEYSNAAGNLTDKINWGEVTGANDGSFTDIGTDKYSTEIVYAASNTPYILGLPKQETLVDQNANTISDTKYYYDSLAWGNVDTGNMTKQENWATSTTYIDTEKTYNDYGLVIQQKDPRDKATNYTYDVYNLYVATSTNPLDQSSQFYYDYSLGQPKEIIDPNGLHSQIVYDGLDRPLYEKQPDLSSPATLVTKTAYTYYNDTLPFSVKQMNYMDAANYYDSYVYYDGLGRKIQERQRAEADNTYAVKDFIYDKTGQVGRESLAYFSTGTSTTAFTENTSLYLNYSYDALGRVSSIVNAVGTTTNAYDDWKMTVTDARDKVKNLYRDAYNNLVQVDEHNGTSTYATYYQYNGLQNLTQIIDAENNIRNFSYDRLGRRLAAEDLHDPSDTTFGIWQYSYDSAGNLVAKVDAQNQTVNYAYDDLNRVLSEDFTGQAGTEVSYDYDDCSYGIGKLCIATSTGSSIRSLAYNALGLVQSESLLTSTTTYITSYDYDRQGHQTYLTYPDGAMVEYEYNDAGLLERTSKKESGEGTYVLVIEDFDYNPLGQISYQKQHNSTETYNIYDANQLYRLTQKITTGPQAGGGDSMMSFAAASSPFNKGGIEGDSGAFNQEMSNPIYSAAMWSDVQNSEAEALPSYKTEEESSNQEVSDLISSNQADLQVDGSIKLKQPQEEIDKRDSTSKSFLTGYAKDGKEMLSTKFYSAPIHYQDKQTGQWKDIDTTLKDGLDAYTMDSAPYQARLKTSIKEDNPIIFINNTQELYLSPSPSLSPVIPAEAGIQEESEGTGIAQKDIYNAEWSNKRVFYKNALAPDINLSISLNDNELIKEAVIKNVNALANLPLRRSAAPPLIKGRIENNPLLTKEGWPEAGEVAAQTYDLSFTLSANQKIDLIAEGQKLSQAKTITTDQMVQIVSNDGTTSYIYPPYAQDSSSITNPNHRINISITYTRNDDGTITLTKHLPEGWAKQAQYPIRTDAVVSYYAASGDAYIRDCIYGQGEWSDHHACANGDYIDTTADGIYVGVTQYYGPTWGVIYRGTLPFDTSFIPDDATVASATLKLYIRGYYNNQATKHWIELVQGDYAINPTTYDFNNVGAVTDPIEGIDTRFNYDPSYTNIYTNQYNSRGLNSTALGWIDKTGYTKLGLRQGNDSDNAAVYAYPQDWEHRSEIQFASSETAGTSQDPYLEIAYTLPNNSPTAPTGLLCESTSTPENIRDPYPEFSAVYTDPNTTDIATSYQIQIATSTAFSYLFWDSNKTNISSTTPQGTRCPDVTYSGPTIPFNDNTYFWRIRFWDENDNTGDWSTSTASFTTSRYLQHLSYAYDSTGNITSIADISDTNASKTTSYTYDDLNRLTSASTTNAVNGQNYSQTYQYSPIGNITYKSDVGYYTYGGNQGSSFANPHAVTQAGTVSYNYDQNGNLASTSAGMVNIWDYNNRLTSTTVGATTTTYRYDESLNRVMYSNGVSTTTYINALYFISGATSTKQIIVNGVVAASIEGTTIHYSHTDHLMGSNVISDENGNAEQVLDYFSFGSVRINEKENSYDNRKKYANHEIDSDTDLTYMQARYQDGKLGRFISQDPWEGDSKNPQSLNRYSYVLNNPLKFIDPLGLRNQTPQENKVAMHMQSLLSAAMSSGNKQEIALYDRLYNGYNQMIKDIPSGGDPKSFTILNDAIFKWYDNQKGYTDWSKNATVKSDYYKPYKGFKCNAFVAETLLDSVGYKKEPTIKNKMYNERPSAPSANSWVNGDIDGYSSTNNPHAGDIIAFDNHGPHGHVGIMFSMGIYISATTNTWLSGQVRDGIVIMTIPYNAYKQNDINYYTYD